MRCPVLVASLWLAAFGLGAQDAGSTSLKPATAKAFDDYIGKAEARIDAQVHGSKFLWADQSPDRLSRLKKGEVVVSPMVDKGDVAVPDGLIHDWIGAVFVPNVTLEKTMAVVQDYDRHKIIYAPEVMDSKLLSRKGNDFKIYLKLLKHKVITVVLNTTHDARFYPLSKTRIYSRSYTTRIAEVKDAGKSTERELPPGKDHGFMWRLNSYWRFEERDGGVYLECEAISLSRDVPLGLGWLITPIVRSLPRESLASTLSHTRAALEPGSSVTGSAARFSERIPSER